MSHIDFNRFGTIQTISSTGSLGSVGATEGQLGGHDIELGTQAKSPSRLSEAASAIKSFFSKIGNTVLSLPGRIMTAYQDYKAERAEQARVREFNSTRDRLLEQLPPGVTVDDQGNVSGTFTATKFPVGTALGNNSDKTFSRSITDGSVIELSAKKTATAIVQPPVYGGIQIAHQANNDFYRMDMQFGSGAGNFDVRRDVQVKGEGARTQQIVQGLRDFTGSDNATTVLSTVMTQNLSRPLLECFPHPDGSFKPMSIEQGKMGGPFHVRDAQGVLQEVKPAGIGALKVSLDRDQNGNFTVSGTWEYFLRGEGRASETTLFAGMDGALVKCNGSITLTIDAAAAAQGRLSFLETPTVEVAFSGRMKT